MKLRSSQIIANVESGRQKMHTSVKERLPSLLEPLRNKYFAFVRNRIFLHPPFYVNPVFAPFSHLFYATASFKIANYVIRLSKYNFWENGMILKSFNHQNITTVWSTAFYVVSETDYIHSAGIGTNRDRFVWYCRMLWSKLSNIRKSPVFYLVLSSDESADIEDRITSRRKINHEHDANGRDSTEPKRLS